MQWTKTITDQYWADERSGRHAIDWKWSITVLTNMGPFEEILSNTAHWCKYRELLFYRLQRNKCKSNWNIYYPYQYVGNTKEFVFNEIKPILNVNVASLKRKKSKEKTSGHKHCCCLHPTNQTAASSFKGGKILHPAGIFVPGPRISFSLYIYLFAMYVHW